MCNTRILQPPGRGGYFPALGLVDVVAQFIARASGSASAKVGSAKIGSGRKRDAILRSRRISEGAGRRHVRLPGIRRA